MTGVAERLRDVQEQIVAACQVCGRDPGTVKLLPVSKRHPAAAILAAMAEGLGEFGENRMQELRSKSDDLTLADVRWHMIGSLQTNKVQQLVRVPGLVLLQTMDRPRLASALQPAAYAEGRTIDVLLQVNATAEPAKHGVAPAEAGDLLRVLQSECPNLPVVGLMAMGPLEGDPRPVFNQVARLRETLRDASGLALPILSMGMTHDLPIAIAAGSTMVRVGTGVFGSRE